STFGLSFTGGSASTLASSSGLGGMLPNIPSIRPVPPAFRRPRSALVPAGGAGDRSVPAFNSRYPERTAAPAPAPSLLSPVATAAPVGPLLPSTPPSVFP